jgi:hypothetical protein
MVDEVRDQFTKNPDIIKGWPNGLFSLHSIARATRFRDDPAARSACGADRERFCFGMNALERFWWALWHALPYWDLSSTTLGTAFDNAKRPWDMDNMRGTPQHIAAVIGDTVGDP